MTETAGFTLVLLDEQGAEIRRIPDVYGDVSWIVPPDDVHGYGLVNEQIEEDVLVRYFQRVKEAPQP